MTLIHTPRRWSALRVLIAMSGVYPVLADPPTLEARRQAAQDADKAVIRGPATLALKDQATLALPEHFGFVPQKEAATLLRTWGTPTDENFIGLIVPLGRVNTK
jgi:uncharacterized membrane-anchored protein